MASALAEQFLLVSHFLSTINSHTFEFGTLLFVTKLIPGTLLPISIYALIRSLAAIVGSTYVGQAVDHGDRLTVVRVSIVGGRLSVALSCLALLFGFWLDLGNHLKYAILACICIPACAEKLCSITNLVSVEKDWVVVIFSDDELQLQMINSKLRRIDLFCKIVGPLLISFSEAWSTTGAIVTLLLFNLICIPVEYFTIARVYHGKPGLQRRGPGSYAPIVESMEVNENYSLAEDSSPLPDQPATSSLSQLLGQYYSSRAFTPSFALSLLYFTVLAFSGQMVTYLLAGGLSSIRVTLLRTVSVVFEIGATWLTPIAMNRVGPIRSGLWFITWQAFWVAAAAYVMWSLTDLAPITAGLGLALGVICSRVGLWGFDLSVQFLVQTEVEEHLRGRFSTAEAALQNVFAVLAYLLTIVFADPSSFKFPVLISAINVAIAAGIYAGFVRKRRGHLLHVACCEK